ncbi:MAG: putative membrane protein [Cellvibrionaceae bacterium]|jgi:putative membrane protein
MGILKKILVGLVAVEHFFFLIVEMFLWTQPLGLGMFGNTSEFAEMTSVLAANQGVYNGFLAAGLIWGLVHPDSKIGFQVKVFFLLCVIVAGLYGGYSVSSTIFFVQAVPALIALAVVWFTKPERA